MGLGSFFKRNKSKKEETPDSSIEINAENCGGCGKCVAVCPNNAYEIVDGVSTLKEFSSCRDCKVCLAACPNNAINMA